MIVFLLILQNLHSPLDICIEEGYSLDSSSLQMNIQHYLVLQFLLHQTAEMLQFGRDVSGKDSLQRIQLVLGFVGIPFALYHMPE